MRMRCPAKWWRQGSTLASSIHGDGLALRLSGRKPLLERFAVGSVYVCVTLALAPVRTQEGVSHSRGPLGPTKGDLPRWRIDADALTREGVAARGALVAVVRLLCEQYFMAVFMAIGWRYA